MIFQFIKIILNSKPKIHVSAQSTGCSTAVDIVGRMAAEWNIPLITPAGADSKFDNKTSFPTLTRLSYSYNGVGRYYLKLFAMFEWSDVVIYTDFIDNESPAFLRIQGSILWQVFMEAGMRPTLIENYSANPRMSLMKATTVTRGGLCLSMSNILNVVTYLLA